MTKPTPTYTETAAQRNAAITINILLGHLLDRVTPAAHAETTAKTMLCAAEQTNTLTHNQLNILSYHYNLGLRWGDE